jgi:hypothetical protein
MVMIPAAPRLGDMQKAEPVPEGIYHVRCDKAEYMTSGPSSKNPGSPMVQVTLTIFGPEEAEEFHGRKLFENLMLTGGGQPRTRQFLEMCGHPDDFVLEDTDLLVGDECGAVVQIDPARKDPVSGQEYEARNRVKRYLPIK